MARFDGVVALDGPSGTGKSTVARRLAQRLGAGYLDTGAMYRAATLGVLHAEVDPEDAQAVTIVVARSAIAVSIDASEVCVSLDGERVEDRIRTAAVTAAVSAVSAVPAVRAQLVAEQRRLIGVGLAAGAGVVVEGRDIASVVCPDAAVKVYLSADAEIRAKRRADEVGEDVKDVALRIERRDRFDSTRQASPLTKAEGAIEIDTTHLEIEEVVAQLLDLASQS